MPPIRSIMQITYTSISPKHLGHFFGSLIT
jgi:hypothetical protein